MMWVLGILGVLVVLVGAAGIAARRFERRQRERGRWDEYGPLEETDVPSTGRGITMDWHAEAMGKRKADFVRRRKPGEHP